MAAVDLADLLTPKTTVIPCAVAVALQAVDKQYREQLEAAIATCAATPPGRRGPIPQDNLIEAFARLGHRISVNKLHDHIRSRCTCG